MKRIFLLALIVLTVFASCATSSEAEKSSSTDQELLALLQSYMDSNSKENSEPTFVAGQTTRAQATNELGKNDIPKPLWAEGIINYVKDAYPEDYIVGVGDAKFATERASRQSAEVRANAEISDTIKSELNNLILDSLQDAGDDVQQQALVYFEQDIIQQSNTILSNVQVLDTWEAKDGRFYVLAGCNAGDALEEFERLAQAEMARQEFYENLENQKKLGLR